jgi:hypothetical protein
MTTQPNAQPATTNPTETAPDPAHTGRVLDERIVTSTDVLAAHITAGTLEAVGRPRLLPTALWPDVDPVVVQAIWDLALTVGWLGGKRSVESRRWEHERLAVARDELAAAGYAAMTERIARVLPPPEHPADAPAGVVRGEHR